LNTLKKKLNKDLKVMTSTKQENDIMDLLNKSQDTKVITNTIHKITELLTEIDSKIKRVDETYTRNNLSLALYDCTNGIESLTGRDNIKNFLALQLYTFSKNPNIFFSNFQNIAIYGPSGIGKTKLAQVIGHVYSVSGILIRNHVHMITKNSLTTSFVNESGKMTYNLLMANLGSLVFIDEAYDLAPQKTLIGSVIDHGSEAITEMVNFLDKMVGLSIVVVAGYQQEMETRFMTANQGLPRRFPNIIILTNYTSIELSNLLLKFLSESCPDLSITNHHGDYVYTLINQLIEHHPNLFSNQAGDMYNLSSCLSQSIYGSIDKTWNTDSPELINNGFNKYLSNKNINLIPI